MDRWRPIHPQLTPSHARLCNHVPYDLKCFTAIEDFNLEAPGALFGWQLNCSGLSQLHCCWQSSLPSGTGFAPTMLSCILAQNCWKVFLGGDTSKENRPGDTASPALDQK